MPIGSSDLKFRLSGGASNTDPAAALGGAMSTVSGGVITSAALNNLFDDVSGDEGDSGDTEYRCIYLENAHGSLTLSSSVLWIQTASASEDTSFEIALGGEGKNGTAETVGDESTAPSGESFSAPSSKGAGLSVGDLDAGDYYPVWVKRIVSAAASAASSDGPTLRWEGDTPA